MLAYVRRARKNWRIKSLLALFYYWWKYILSRKDKIRNCTSLYTASKNKKLLMDVIIIAYVASWVQVLQPSK